MNSFELARRELGWSMELLAEKAGCHLGTVAASEGRGGREPLSVKTRTARDIAVALSGGDEFKGIKLMTEWISETTTMKGRILVRFTGESDLDRACRAIEEEPELERLRRLRG